MAELDLLNVVETPSKGTQERKDLLITVSEYPFIDANENTSTRNRQGTLGYWKTYFADCESTPFPVLPPLAKDPVVDSTVEHHLPRLMHPAEEWHVTESTILCTAWSLIAGQMTASKDVTFGVAIVKDVSVDEKEESTVPDILPMRFKLGSEADVLAYLSKAQQQVLERFQFEQVGLSDIINVSEDSRQACMFQTLLVIRSQRTGLRPANIGKLQHHGHALVIDILPRPENLTVRASFDSKIIQHGLVKRLLERLGHVAMQLKNASPEKRVTDIETTTPSDLEDIWRYNHDIPTLVERCVHEAIESLALAQPSASAICAWDGELTYHELDRLASILSCLLAKIGVGPDVLVPLCFEKSMWTPVAMLGVLKAGGAFVLLDPTFPKKRLQGIVRQLRSNVFLSSTANRNLSLQLAHNVLVINSDTFTNHDTLEGEQKNAVIHHASPASTAYVVFTSGSTGTPKGVKITHGNIASAFLRKKHLFGCTADSRIYDLASYSFTAALSNFFAALTAGGCLCIPNDQDRTANISHSFLSLQSNTVILTPSVAATLSPGLMKGLRLLILTGEVVRMQDIQRWWGHTRLLSVYGNSECGGCVTINDSASSPEQLASAGIGKGAGAVTWVVDPDNHHHILPPGCIGELLIESPIVSPGYLIDPTTDVFIQAPAWMQRGTAGFPGRNARLYKTGDLVQQNEDGTLNYVGRKDSQIKIRGQRIELGDVEYTVQNCLPGAIKVIAELIIPQGEEAKPTLAVFLVMENRKLIQEEENYSDVTFFPIAEAIETRLSEELPSHMIPSVFFSLQKVPMTATGKINRRQLRQMGSRFSMQQLAALRTASRGEKRQPSTEAEQKMQRLWAQVLGLELESIGLDDSFFRLGGDSIAAMKLVGEARREGMPLSVAEFFRHPKLVDLVSTINHADVSSSTPLPRMDQVGPVEQSFAQGRLWFLEELHPGLDWYLIPFAMHIRGPLQLIALNAALHAIERRHETLRTTFTTNDGVSMQMARPFSAKELTVVDLPPGDKHSCLQVVREQQMVPFDLRTEPGWRVAVYRLDKDDHVLSIVMHHIVSDGWSVDVLTRELATFYSASLHGQDPLSQVQPLPVQYRDFSVWQRQQAQAEEHEKQLSYWVTQLQTSRPAELLCDKPRPATLSGKADMQTLEVGGSLYAKLQQFCKARGVTLFIALLAVFRATHFRLTGQDDAIIGTVNANRDRWELRDMIGFFVNMQCLRITVEDETFEELVQQVQAVAVASLDNQDVPFEHIVSKLKGDRDLSRNPLAQLIFVVHSQRNLGQLTLEGVETEVLDDATTSRFDLEFHFFQQTDGLQGNVIFSTDLYLPETIDNMLSVFSSVLEGCLREPTARIASLLLLTDADHAKLDEMGLIRVEEVPYPRESSIVDLFRQQASAHPSRVAVKDEREQMTYAALDRASDVLAGWLAKRSLAPETLVGVFANRCCETIVALLGVMKADLAYLPFDVKTPSKRMETILSSLPGQRLIFVGANVQPPNIKLSNVKFVRIAEALEEQANNQSASKRSGNTTGPSATSLAYVMFTSGSTGQPKGVMVEHRGVVRLAVQNNLVKHLPATPIMAHLTSLAFDVSTWEIYASLLNGGTIVCIDTMTALDPLAMLPIVRQHDIQVAFFTPPLFRQYIVESPAVIAALEMLCVGGEVLYPRDFHAAETFLKGSLVNFYGPTENTSCSTIFALTQEEKYTNGVPIGRALSNSGAYVMDAKLQLVPLGVVGELVVTGDGVARGYTDPERDVDRFVSVVISGQTVKAYRTGDYVRYRPTDGQLEFFGRIDGQVKLRGQRIELAEIEHVLRSHQAVGDAVAVLQQRDDGHAQLAGFVTIREDAAMADGQDEDAGDNDQEQYVDVWEEQFDAKIYSPIDRIRPETIGRDFIGWTSMYDGSEIDKAEMNEWLDDTIETLLNGGQPGRVLEIGSGTGMILFNLGSGLQSYVGLDPSRKAVEFVARTAETIPALAGRVHMYKATAVDIGRLQGHVTANLAVVNSVVQYFPSQEYLFKVVQELLAVEGMHTLFFGDIRSYALYQEFLATRALHIAGNTASKAEIRRIMADMRHVEREFFVDPAFFTSLADRLPDLVEHVEILPKKMKATNELSCYRYAAIVHIKSKGRQEHEIVRIKDEEWIDFTERELDFQTLRQELKNLSSSLHIAICNIPHSKTIVGRCLAEWLDDVAVDALDHQDWLSSIHQKAKTRPSLSATDLVELAREAGCRVEISWGRQHSQHGGLDAVFHKYQLKNGANRVMFRFPTDHIERLQHTLTNKPMREQVLQKTQQQLQQMLQAQLPTYMVPQTITALDAMPVNQNGKVDRSMLAQWKQEQTADRGPILQPRTEMERTLQQLWARVLKIDADRIGLDNSFFRLGGDSIAAMKLVGEARRAGVQLSVADLFRHPVLAALAGMCADLEIVGIEEISAFSLLGNDTDAPQVREEVAAACSVEASVIEDVYPCSPLQEGLMSLTLKKAGDYIMQSVLELGAGVDEDVFRAAWEQVVRSTAILRTRIVQHSQLGLLQVVVAEDVRWFRAEALEDYLEKDKSVSMGLGDQLTRYAFVKDPREGKRWFVWTVHHAMYDGWTLPRILHAVAQVYGGGAVGSQSNFNAFIRYIGQQDQKATELYWKNTLADCESALFPALPSTVTQPVADTIIKYQCPPFKVTSNTTTSTLIRAAWAIVTSHYTSSDDVVFGTTVTGRNAPITGIDTMLGPTIATVPVRVRVQEDQSVSVFLGEVQEQATDMIAHEQTGLQRIAKMGPGARHACGFQTQLVVQPAGNPFDDDKLGVWQSRSAMQHFTTYALTLQFTLAAEGIRITASFDARVIEHWLVEKMLSQVSFVIQQLAEAHPTTKVADIDVLTLEDRQQLWAQNQEVPLAVERCIHELFAEQVKARPSAPAICAWDGEMTYAELNDMSSRLADYLVDLGVKTEDIVPLCFEKSMWTVVAMLGVLKAGAAIAPLDSNHPAIRHQEIFRQTKARLVLASEKYSTLCKGEDRRVVAVSKASICHLPSQVGRRKRIHGKPQPSNAAYVIFTSGSTGTPKGVVVEHRALSTSCLHHGKAFGFTQDTRALQFASYAFGACIPETITALLYGGCTCVPSDDQRRNNLAQAINAMSSTHAILTPSVARLLKPADVSTLQVVIMAGEQITSNDWRRWGEYTQIINGYGCAECSVCCNVYSSERVFAPGTIGHAVGSVGWVVNPADHNRILPLGSIGELLVEGPILARGYLGDAEKTAGAFIQDPAWLVAGGGGYPGRRGRLYKTGDLVRYDANGSLVYIGRKDEQVKVSGQRVELGEIEHHVRECMLGVKQIAAEMIVPGGRGEEKKKSMIAVFVLLEEEAEGLGEPEDGHLPARVMFPTEVDEKLAARLPGYMVPDVYFAVTQLPMTTSGKIDRKRLREMGASFSAQQLAELRTRSQGPKRGPSTEAERKMQRLWARVLDVEPDSFGLDDSFFQLGGDSIAAMKLVAEARKEGFQLTVASIFQHPRLVGLATLVDGEAPDAVQSIAPFSLLGSDSDAKIAQILEEVTTSCSMEKDLVEDIYPCSPLQEGLMSLTSKRAGDYIMQSVLELRVDVDEDAFRAAWGQIVQSMAILRTRIVQHSTLGLLQTVVAEGIQWVNAQELGEYLKQDKLSHMDLGEPLTRYALVKNAQEQKRWFVWTIHHALYDGWSLPLVINAVNTAYTGVALEKQPSFSTFIKYLSQLDQGTAATYWQTALADCEATPFPALPSTAQQPVADAIIEYQCLPLPKTATDATTSTLIRAAWAIVAGRYTDSDDVVFGATVTGRNAPVAGIETMAGPTITTVPVRIRLQRDGGVINLLANIQQQATEMIPFEQTGLQRIAKMGPGAQHACGFQMLLVVQPADAKLESEDMLGSWQSGSELQDFTTYALMLQCTLAAEGVKITASFDARAIEHWLVKKILGQLDFVMQQLARADSKMKVADIETTTPEDRQKLWHWNQEVPPAVERCIHDLFVEQARARLDAPAVCAWDGELTYGELDALSTRLAGHLVQLGVKCEEVVPLCFEKSMWTVVGMLAVLKAGSAFLLLDPSLPAERLALMCGKACSTRALASEECLATLKGLVDTIVVVNKQSIRDMPERKERLPPAVPASSAYVIFTSGSTGEPKGYRVGHRSSCSAVKHQGPSMQVNSSTRVLQFGSYSFAGCLVEMLHALAHGGCICIPSEEERRANLASAMSRMAVNWAFLTPTALDTIGSPESVPSLATLCIGGEPIRASQIQLWQSRVHLRQTYGSSETAGVVSSTRLTDASTTKDVGKASTAVYWIVDPNHHHRLAPLGAAGELLVEGPVLGLEYINEEEKTAATFVQAPAWRQSFNGGEPRLYKTGDLSKYKEDGSIELLGRKDTQVKLRGQRIELGEIEHQARLSGAVGVKGLAVELIRPESKDDTLACFIAVEWNEQVQEERDGVLPANCAQAAVQTIRERLERFLPQYMVPVLFVPLAQLPTSSSQKVDRKRLRAMGASFTPQQLIEMRTFSQEPKRQPTTDVERMLQQLWARVLKIDAENIGLDDSFFRLGGDSIAAMKLVAEARREDVQLTVADIFRNAILTDLAPLVQSSPTSAPQSTSNFSSLAPTLYEAIFCGVIQFNPYLHLDNAENIEHVSSIQSSFLTRGKQNPRAAFNYIYFDLDPCPDVKRLETSCRSLTEHFALLRTHFAYFGDHLLQVVLRKFHVPFLKFEVNGRIDEESNALCLRDIEQSSPLGVPTSFMFIFNASKASRLIIRLSHAQYDGICLPVILNALASFYHNQPLSPAPDFSTYLAYSHQRNEVSACYWRKLLKGSRVFPIATKLSPTPCVDEGPHNIELEHSMTTPQLPHGITLASLVSSAWALVLSQISGKEDVVYGYLVAGRNSDIPGIAEIVGPCVNIVPVRADVSTARTGAGLLHLIQDQYVSLRESDSMDFRDIVQQCTDWPAGTVLDSVIHHRNIDAHPEICLAGGTSKVQWFNNPFVVTPYIYVCSEAQPSGLYVTIAGNTHIFTTKIAEELLDILCKTITKLSNNLQVTLAVCKSPIPILGNYENQP